MRKPDDYHQLIADTVSERADKLGRLIDYIEVGVLTGNSAEAVLATCKIRNAILIDNFSNTYCGEWKSSKQQVEQRLARFDGLFQVIEGDSNEILPHVIDEFDVAFIDGDHSERGCWNDMEHILPLMRSDGIIFVDDLNEHGSNLRGTFEKFAIEKQLNRKYHEVHNGLGELTRCPH